MRWLRRLAAVLGAVLVVALAVAPQAVAGGPTSVLLTSPASAETSALYYSTTGYRQLEKHLALGDAEGTSQRPVEVSESGRRQINVTWLIHDVSVWRVDRVHLPERPGATIWISTSTDIPAQTEDRWHKAGDPAGLRGMLDQLGLMGESTDSDAGGADYPPDFTRDGTAGTASGPNASEGTGQPESAVPAASSARAAASSGATSGWWWALPGLAAGAVLALLLRSPGARLVRAASRRRDVA